MPSPGSTLQTGSHRLLRAPLEPSVPASLSFVPQVSRGVPSRLTSTHFLLQFFSSFWKFCRPFVSIPRLCPPISPSLYSFSNSYIFDVLFLASMSLNFSLPFSFSKHLCSILRHFLISRSPDSLFNYSNLLSHLFNDFLFY